jgi:hypothetical protein
MKAIILIMVLALVLISGCSEETKTTTQTQPAAEYCIDANSNGICDNYESSASAEQQTETAAPECEIEGLECSSVRITENKIQFSIKNTLDRDITVHSISFSDVNCERTFDEKLFRDSTEAFIIPCSLTPGSELISSFTVKYAIGDATVPKTGIISGIVLTEN